ncbi:serine protease 33-like [Ambystoma mexicanum]|uniref:serine protease 33-like n=1 Tax=Ambystoma mexicanum TaxID=8296 RepID=UPI0037E7B6EE
METFESLALSALVQTATQIYGNTLDHIFCLIDHQVVVKKASLPSTNDFSACGSPVISDRIVGGQDANNGQWPWQISLQQNGIQLCGGSLITEAWVLMAAHCFPSGPFDLSVFRVYLGAYQLSQNNVNPNVISTTPKRVIINSNYTSEGSSGDIALLELAAPVQYTSYIRPVCLPAPSVHFPAGMKCWVTGWGNIQDGVSLTSPMTLQEVQVPLIDQKTCDNMYHVGSGVSQNYVFIKYDMICAGYQQGQKDSCQGDSGGPLVCNMAGSWFLAGVVSWGYGCAEANRPGVYTMVTAYNAWIKQYVPEVQFSSPPTPNITISTATASNTFHTTVMPNWIEVSTSKTSTAVIANATRLISTVAKAKTTKSTSFGPPTIATTPSYTVALLTASRRTTAGSSVTDTHKPNYTMTSRAQGERSTFAKTLSSTTTEMKGTRTIPARSLSPFIPNRGTSYSLATMIQTANSGGSKILWLVTWVLLLPLAHLQNDIL